MVTQEERKNKYCSKGYVELKTDSGTGSTVLVNYQLNQVVKINQDTAYNVFVDFIKTNMSLCVPQVYNFEEIGEPPYEGVKGFTIVEMEKLIALSEEESNRYTGWINDYWGCKRSATLPSDDFGLLETIESLLENAKSNNVSIDLNKSTNVMKRSDGKYVITDPYN